MNDTTIRVIGGLYVALCSALSDQGVELANDLLFRLADDPQTEDLTHSPIGLLRNLRALTDARS